MLGSQKHWVAQHTLNCVVFETGMSRLQEVLFIAAGIATVAVVLSLVLAYTTSLSSSMVVVVVLAVVSAIADAIAIMVYIRSDKKK